MMRPDMQQAFLDLRIFLQDHFIAIEERFAYIEEKLIEMDQRILTSEDVESEDFASHIVNTNTGDTIDTHLERMDRRFDNLELSLFDISQEIKTIQEKVFSHEIHLENLTRAVNSFISLHQTTEVEFSIQRAKNERVEQRIKLLEKTVM